MNTVIITGGDGFVGSYTTEYFLNQGLEVLVLSRAEAPKRLSKHPNLSYLCCDLSNPETLIKYIKAEKYDTFIHFAWQASAGVGRMDYNLQVQNAIDTVECMKVAKKLGCRRFLCAGSIMEKEVTAVVEDQGSRPGMAYIYGMGKYMAHCMCKSVAADIGIDLIWPMITNAYGIGETSPRMLNSTLRKIINGEPLQFTAATQNYDFVYVTDVAKAFYLIAKNGKPFCEYMVGSGNARPLKEFLLEMQQTLVPERKCLFGNIPYTGKNMPLETFDVTQTEKDCKFKAEVSFSDGIRMTMNWLKQFKNNE
ncbi:NAD-dependent epimerase/dehydratase family protein [Treponema socranskii]|uniref:NAD-dependent epimerase/dehydratase family protein n=1 Tax=Treponema socranskii TaxID=53419 RepID=UPI003D6F5712